MQTAGVWQRGILVDDYGVSPKETQWFVGSIHHWHDHAEEEIEPRDGSTIQFYAARKGDPQAEDSFHAISQGQVDLVGVTENQTGQLLADGRFPRLFPNYLAEERAYHERMVGELTEASRRLEAFIRELQAKQRKLARIPPPKGGIEAPAVGFGALKGRLPWPTEGKIVTGFGAQVHPRFGTRTFRNGVDIEAAVGREVLAVHGGHVIYTGWFKGYGNLIIVDHGNEYYTLYAHIADIEAKEGDDVRQGQRIGTVGDTGSLAGPRLYFEVRYQGRPQDPEQWLRQGG